MVKYTGSKDLLEVIAEGMRTPRTPIRIPTDQGDLLLRVTGTSGKIIYGQSVDGGDVPGGKLVTIDPDAPELITVS